MTEWACLVCSQLTRTGLGELGLEGFPKHLKVNFLPDVDYEKERNVTFRQVDAALDYSITRPDDNF